MQTLQKKFQEQGVSLLPRLCTGEQTEALYQMIQASIRQCASELNCSIEDYLRNVSRWADPSPVTCSIHFWVKPFFSKVLSDVMGQELALVKMNIISKSAYAHRRIPCHQDIAYSHACPYEFSLWFALHDVTPQDGILEFLPGSHMGEIAPAVDFWQPDFIDEMALSPTWQAHFISLPVQRGDAILFDSRIWHRSADSHSSRNRFAIVTRWSRLDYQPPANIPEKIPAVFGMWTCGSLTESLLQQGLVQCFHENVAADLNTTVQIWQAKLYQREKIPFAIDRIEAQKALNDLLILHQAAQRHNGGDAQGLVYPNLWTHFLEPLSKWLNRSKYKRGSSSYESTI